MTATPKVRIGNVINELYKDSKFDKFKILKNIAKWTFRPMQPSDFKDAYLSISQEQGEELVNIIKDNNFKNIVEFGTSFGISTLFLAQGAMETGGHIVTSELLETKAEKAINNFKNAGVADYIEMRVGDAMETLNDYGKPIDLLLLDGWKDLYLSLFEMLKSNFHSNSLIYVDNADMEDSLVFLNTIAADSKYFLESKHNGKVVLIRMKKYHGESTISKY